MLPQFPLDTRATISGIIDMIGRDILFYNVVSISGCYSCSLDVISNTSTDSYCPVCSGNYWIPTYSGTQVKAHITYGTVDDKSWTTGGLVDNGQIEVKFMHTQELEDLVNEAKFFVVDNRELDVKKITPRGAPQTNRIIVQLKEKER